MGVEVGISCVCVASNGGHQGWSSGVAVMQGGKEGIGGADTRQR